MALAGYVAKSTQSASSFFHLLVMLSLCFSGRACVSVWASADLPLSTRAVSDLELATGAALRVELLLCRKVLLDDLVLLQLGELRHVQLGHVLVAALVKGLHPDFVDFVEDLITILDLHLVE